MEETAAYEPGDDKTFMTSWEPCLGSSREKEEVISLDVKLIRTILIRSLSTEIIERVRARGWPSHWVNGIERYHVYTLLGASYGCREVKLQVTPPSRYV